MLEPKVIVADEPVSALDVSIRSQVLNLMKRLQAEHGMASVVISHDLAVVKYLADRIGVMYLGKIVELGTGDDIYRRPAHPYTDALIKTIPLPDPAAERAKTDVGIRGELPSPIDPAVGLPLPDPLPAGAGEVRRGGAAAAPLRPRPSGGLPLPAAPGGGRERRARRAEQLSLTGRQQFPTRAAIGSVSHSGRTTRGTHTGEFIGKPVTGRAFEIEAIHLYRIENGHVAEHWAKRDDVGLAKQIGCSSNTRMARRRGRHDLAQLQ